MANPWPTRWQYICAIGIPCTAYQDEGSPHWLYTRALLAFRAGQGGADEVARLVRDAWSENEHVPAILAGTASPVLSDADYITVGGPDEGAAYIAESGPAWRSTPGAVEWLTKTVAALPPKPTRTRRLSS